MQSMTGYGSAEKSTPRYAIFAAARSVNNRFLDIHIHLPPIFADREPEIRDVIASGIARGKVEAALEVRRRDQTYAVRIDHALAKAYISAYTALAKILASDLPLSPSALMRMDGVCTIEKADPEEALWRDLKACFEHALRDCVRLRARDGEAARRDFEKQLKLLEARSKRIRTRAAGRVPEYAKELARRLESMIGKTVDTQLIVTEAAILASRSDIHEELERFASHIALFREEMKKTAGCGRTLDFIAQEMNREINTIGSKQTDSLISREVIAIKTILEQIREQVRNIE
ncbi:MAG: YicC family protein [Spirochaetota bacterium]|jgi:uncharacterized protein (TIGR00255 family)|nr:YicC family protein [Spirochaetota bacterium]